MKFSTLRKMRKIRKLQAKIQGVPARRAKLKADAAKWTAEKEALQHELADDRREVANIVKPNGVVTGENFGKF